MKNMNFTETESNVYEEILKNVKLKKKESVIEIAKKAGVAPSFVVKVAKKLGYSGLNEMFYTLSTYTEAISFSFKNFDMLGDELLDTHVQMLCDMLWNYKNHQIIVNSIGDSDYIGSCLLNKLWHRGFSAMPYHHEMALKDSPLKPGMLIAINESGVVLLQQCIEAKKHDFNIVSITSNRKSPLACNSHLTIEFNNKKSTFKNYNPNFFAAYVNIFIEIWFSRYDDMVKKM